MTERDEKILTLIARHKYMTATQVMKGIGINCLRICQRRLKVLTDAGFLAHYVPYNYPHGQAEYIHYLTAEGYRAIGGHYSPRRGTNPSYLSHYLSLNDWVLSQRYDNVEIEPSVEGYRPDAYAIKAMLGVRKHYYIELDRGTESEKQIAKKVAAYEGIYRKARFMPYVLFVCPDARRIDTLKRWVERNRKTKEIIYIYELHQNL